MNTTITSHIRRSRRSPGFVTCPGVSVMAIVSRVDPLHKLALGILLHVMILVRDPVPLLRLSTPFVQLLLIGAGDGGRDTARPLEIGDPVPFLVLPIPLLSLQTSHVVGILLRVQSLDLEARQIGFQELFENWEVLGIGAVGSAIVINDQLIVERILRRFRRIFLREFRSKILRCAIIGLRALAHEELARVRNVNRDITVHRVLAQHIDSELLPGFGEPPLSIQGQDIGEYPPALVVVYKIQELLRQVDRRRVKHPIDREAIIVIDTVVLMVECSVEDSASQAVGGEHACDEGPELDISMVERGRNGSRKLELNSLEATEYKSSR